MATSWTTAIANGNITPFGTSQDPNLRRAISYPLSHPTSTFYAQRVAALGLSGYEQEVPGLTADFVTSDGSTSKKSLVMSWSQPTASYTLGVSSWQFAYHADPDLTGLKLFFGALAPVGSQDLGVELVDTSGRSAGWYTSSPQLGLWDSNYTIDPSVQAAQGQFSTFIKDPGFDITHVLQIRFNEASLSNDPFSVPNPTGNGAAWNGWSYLVVASSL